MHLEFYTQFLGYSQQACANPLPSTEDVVMELLQEPWS